MNTDALFKNFKSSNLELKNRIAMAPMTRSKSPGNIPNDLTRDYYARRAQHNVGLIITEGVNIDHPAAAGYPDVPVLHGEALPAWTKVTQAVHAQGGKIAAQLWHVGCLRSPEFDPEKKVPSVSPSGIYYLDKERLTYELSSLSESEAEEIVFSFARAVKNAQEAGFDAIEFHGAHGYLIDQFFWDKTNKRSDRFGGSNLNKRTSFAVEIVKESRKLVGPEFPLIFRFSNWKLADYKPHLFGNPNDLEQFLQPLVAAGIDVFHASTRNFDTPEFSDSQLNLAGWTKKLSGKPTISVGSVGLAQDFTEAFNECEAAEYERLMERMSKGEFDLIAIGRALLGDPELVDKLERKDLSSIKPYDKDALDTLY